MSVPIILAACVLAVPPSSASVVGQVQHYRTAEPHPTIDVLDIREAPRTVLKPSDGVWHPGEVDPIGMYCNCAMCRRNRRAADSYDEAAYDPTPMDGVAFMLGLVSLGEDDVLYDLGCGDGRVVVAAAKLYGCRAVGIEVNEERAEVARRNARRNGVDNLVSIYTKDAARVSIHRWATVVTVYGDREMLSRLKPRLEELRPGTNILSYQHPMPGWPASKPEVRGKHRVYRYHIATEAERGFTPEAAGYLVPHGSSLSSCTGGSCSICR